MSSFSGKEIKSLIEELKALAAEYDPPKSTGAVSEHAGMLRRAANAFQRYVDGEQQSLDEAFGIQKPDGRTKDKLNEDREEVLRDAYEMYFSDSNDLTWDAIHYELNAEAVGIKSGRRLCTLVTEQKERLEGYFKTKLPVQQIVRELEKAEVDRAIERAKRKQVRAK